MACAYYSHTPFIISELRHVRQEKTTQMPTGKVSGNRKALRSRHTGAGSKPPRGNVNVCGISRLQKTEFRYRWKGEFNEAGSHKDLCQPLRRMPRGYRLVSEVHLL